MKIKILAIGTKMPSWVQAGVDEYIKRFPRELCVEFKEIPLGNRGKNADLRRAIKTECDHMLSLVEPKDHVVAMEVEGKSWSTEQFARSLSDWQMLVEDVCLLIGGPDGLNQACRERANQKWSLSPLTLPHPLVRVLLTEQLYRAWSINANHPYHRA